MFGTSPFHRASSQDSNAAERRPVISFLAGGRSMRPRDAAAILLVWVASVCLALFVDPHHAEASTAELLYYTLYNVAVGSLVGFHFFDRLAKDGFALFALRASSAILGGTLVNESIISPLAFGTGPINGVSVYYALGDSLSVAGVFVLIRLAQALRAAQQRLHREPQEPSSGPADPARGCLFVRAARGTERIHAEDIVYMAAERDFTRIVCVNGEHFVSENLKSLLERSVGLGLVRVHKSFAVNLGRVERLARAEVKLGSHSVPVGRRYRPSFKDAWRSRPAACEVD